MYVKITIELGQHHPETWPSDFAGIEDSSSNCITSRAVALIDSIILLMREVVLITLCACCAEFTSGNFANERLCV